ncbi:MAG: hypothetical protein A3D74_03380 [Candidatus Levybacteria bacterium RIFCSPHIGHO2_02_FULL_37_13]|nr:MAG: hypothetical protein A3D74_03380 [Candidatus Levybacteria bacterium RIFCSPHIGHO2_02_FULL_37_13]OGH29802.1 MAG: hypothetical protein A3E40_02315 [Candidatus Levybacteria bacterium RIFCSPHIGHO2_12_FULL_37_9]OGH39991.1 MAG: hypothetical protein A3B41_03365 [Candidatus Levybacteria bacterium RIFCSPLOWO2_01_FULL_37_26]
MNEREFLKTLEERAKEQEKLIKGMVLPKVFTTISFWLGNHPWRILIPISIIITLILHGIFGKSYDEFILKIFGKL